MIVRPTGAKAALMHAVQAVARRAGFDLIRTSYSSPVPDLSQVRQLQDAERLQTPGLEFDWKRQLAVLQQLRPHIEEFYALYDARALAPFVLDNPMFGAVDAEVLFAMVRAERPRRVIEVGSGYSTHLLVTAADLNGGEGRDTTVTSIDPQPRISAPASARHEHVSQSLEGLGESRMAELAAGDILFIDSSHVVKTGGDVTHLILEILPALPSGILVHFHDVFIPWDYPPANLLAGKYWTEQYLLQAFLAQNESFGVHLALHAIAREHPDAMGIFRAFRESRDGLRPSPGSFWIRSNGPTHSSPSA